MAASIDELLAQTEGLITERTTQVTPGGGVGGSTKITTGMPTGQSPQAAMTPEDMAPGMVTQGNIDLNSRPRVSNPDGSTSTLSSESSNYNGKEVLYPTISPDGKRLSSDEARQQYEQSGQHLGQFNTPEDATAYAKSLSERQDQMLQDEANKTSLDRLNDVADAAMKERGVSYLPDLKNLKTPQDQEAGVSFARDMLAGLNHNIATVLGAPNDAVNRALSLLGSDFLSGKGTGSDGTIAAFNRMGIDAYKVETIGNKIGQGILPAMAEWAAIQTAAPYLAAQQGISTVAFLAKSVGEWALRHPALGAFLSQTGQAGGKVAKDVTGSDNPLVEFGGELAGGVAGSAAVGSGKLAMKGARLTGLPQLAEKAYYGATEAAIDSMPANMRDILNKYGGLYRQPKPGDPEALIGGYDPKNVQSFAQNQVDGAMMRQEQAINDAIDGITATGSAARNSQLVHGALLKAEKISKRIVSQFWDRTPLNERIPVNGLKRDVLKVANELDDTPFVKPDGLINEILSVSSPIKDDITGKFIKAAPTIRRLRDIQSRIGNEITAEYAKDAPNEGWARNLNRLSGMIDDAIVEALPNNTSIAQARAMSKRHNDLFSRGPINSVLAKRRTGEFRVNPGETVDKLTGEFDGLQSLKNVRDEILQYPRVPTGKFVKKGTSPFATTQEEGATLDGMIDNAEQSIRAQFKEAAASDGPAGAAKYAERTAEGVKPLAQVSGELEFTAQKLRAALAEKTAIEKSALARFAQADPDKAVTRVFNDVNPQKVAKELVAHFGGDKDAMEGFRSAVLRELIINRGSGDPEKVRKLLDTSKFGNLAQEVLDPSQYARLSKMVDSALYASAHAGETGLGSRLTTGKYSPVTVLGRVIGASVGGHVARLTGHGNIQTSGLGANIIGRQFEKTFGSMDPGDLFTMAVLDPRWEKLLYSRIPTNTKQMRQAAVNFRRLFSILDTSRNQAQDALAGD